MQFVAYYGPGRLPLWIQQRTVRGWVKQKEGLIVQEIIVDRDDSDFSFIGLKEAKRLAIKHRAAIIAQGYDVLSRNGKVFLEAMDTVSMVTCEFPFRQSRQEWRS